MGQLLIALLFLAPALSHAQMIELKDHNLSPLTALNLAQGVRATLEERVLNRNFYLDQKALGRTFAESEIEAECKTSEKCEHLPSIDGLEVRDLALLTYKNSFMRAVTFLDEKSVLYAESKVDVTYSNEAIRSYDCSVKIFFRTQSVKLKDCETVDGQTLADMTLDFTEVGVEGLEKSM